jgi:hypothetical protein
MKLSKGASQNAVKKEAVSKSLKLRTPSTASFLVHALRKFPSSNKKTTAF